MRERATGGKESGYWFTLSFAYALCAAKVEPGLYFAMLSTSFREASTYLYTQV